MIFKFKRLFNDLRIVNKKLLNIPNEINIKEIKKIEYKTIFNREKIINLSHIQSPDYYQDTENSKYLKITNGLKVIAIVSILKKKVLFNLLTIARVNDGPMIVEGYSKAKNIILKLVLKFVRENYSIFISLAPSYIYDEKNFFESITFINLKNPPNKTYSIDLLKTEKYLFNNLKSNWRNGLKKGLKSVSIREIDDLEVALKIFKEYEDYANKLGFKPVSFKKNVKWFKNYLYDKGLLNLKIYNAYGLNSPENNLGSIGILCFKNKALYLFGYTNMLGKKYQANVAMLWYSIINRKENGFTEFDLGGFNAKTSKGIKKFKEGLNGNIRKTLGEFIYIGIF